MNRKKPLPRPFREITEDEVALACALRSSWLTKAAGTMWSCKTADTLVCYCYLCNDLRTFMVTV